MEMLAYHRQCTETEIQELRQAESLDKQWQDQLLWLVKYFCLYFSHSLSFPSSLNFNTLQLNETQQLQAAFLMFSNLVHTSSVSSLFDSDTVFK